MDFSELCLVLFFQCFYVVEMVHRINYIEIFIVTLVLIIVSCYLDMASGDSACFLAHGKVIVISLCICKPIELIKSAVIVNQSLRGTLETQVSIALFRVWRHTALHETQQCSGIITNGQH